MNSDVPPTRRKSVSDMKRPDWDDYWMQMARAASTRGTCDRKQVGCVLVSDTNRLLSSGYNGSLDGDPHCYEAGHDMDHGHCVRTVHAEVNALLNALEMGVQVKGAKAYVTAHPCWNCYKLLRKAGISAIVFAEAYRVDERIEKHAEATKFRLIGVGGGSMPQEPEPSDS